MEAPMDIFTETEDQIKRLWLAMDVITKKLDKDIPDIHARLDKLEELEMDIEGMIRKRGLTIDEHEEKLEMLKAAHENLIDTANGNFDNVVCSLQELQMHCHESYSVPLVSEVKACECEECVSSALQDGIQHVDPARGEDMGAVAILRNDRRVGLSTRRVATSDEDVDWVGEHDYAELRRNSNRNADDRRKGGTE